MEDSYNGVIEKYTKFGFIDYQTRDINFIKEIFGEDFDFNNNYVLVIDRYGRFEELHNSSYSLRQYSGDWNVEDPWLYIECTANSTKEIKAIYSFVSYDFITSTLILNRTYQDIDVVEEINQVCYDLVPLRGFDIFNVHICLTI